MTLYLFTPPALEPVTLAEAKQHLRVTHADDDDFIAKLIAAARRQVEMRTALRLISQQWKFTLDCWPEDGIILIPLTPVSAVNEIKSFGNDDQETIIDPSHYFLDAASHPARVAFRQGRAPQTPGRIINGIELTVTAGFGATPAAVPQELKQAMLLMLGNWFANRGEAEPDSSMPLLAIELLRPFRTRRIA
jgi:uncharacterized phiE125 gp8 family phage protein